MLGVAVAATLVEVRCTCFACHTVFGQQMLCSYAGHSTTAARIFAIYDDKQAYPAHIIHYQ